MNKLDYRSHPDMKSELDDAYRHCYEVSPQAAERLFLAVEAQILRIFENPTLYRVVHKVHDSGLRLEIRKAGPLRSFPYNIYYAILPDKTVFMYALAHTSREPDYWIKRKAS
jgi:plasmid stabilization system protein ParE